jgi:hypothetical protein
MVRLYAMIRRMLTFHHTGLLLAGVIIPIVLSVVTMRMDIYYVYDQRICGLSSGGVWCVWSTSYGIASPPTDGLHIERGWFDVYALVPWVTSTGTNIPLWVVTAVTLIAWWAWRPRVQYGCCVACGYDMSGIERATSVCPECGTQQRQVALRSCHQDRL